MERSSYTPEWRNPQERVEDALARLEDGLYATFDQEDFRHFLTAQALFHDYSARNVMLILAQRPEATRCASFATWKQLGRWVRKGEKGIAVRVPIVSTIEREDPETGEFTVAEILRGFRLGHVFDVSQTDGRPLPEPPRPQELFTNSEIGRGISRYLRAYLEANGITVVRERMRERHGRLGYYDHATRTVGVERFLSEDQTASVLLHEGTHALTGARALLVGKAHAETVAEGTAYVVADFFGLDTASWSIAYAAGWAQAPAVVQDSLESIRRASGLLIAGMTTAIGTEHAGQARQPGPGGSVDGAG